MNENPSFNSPKSPSESPLQQRYAPLSQDISSMYRTSADSQVGLVKQLTFLHRLRQNRPVLQEMISQSPYRLMVDLHSLIYKRNQLPVLGNFAQEFIMDNLQAIEAQMQAALSRFQQGEKVTIEDSNIVGFTVESLKIIAKNRRTPPQLKNQIYSLLDRNLDSFLQRGASYGFTIDAIDTLIESPNPAHLQHTFDSLLVAIQSPNLPDFYANFVLHADFLLHNDNRKNAKERFKGLAQVAKANEARIISSADALLTRLGFTGDEIATISSNWQASDKGENSAIAILGNYTQMLLLERDKPEICRTLFHQFGIKHFRRYPRKLLIHQYENRDKSDLPHGVTIYPDADHNGAFSQHQFLFSKLEESMDSKYYLRIYEAGDKDKIRTALEGASKRYGKISYLIIGGHGDRDVISFNNNQSGALQEADLPSVFNPTVFTDKPLIALFSCNTGRNSLFMSNIARSLSGVVPGIVIAPNRVTYPKEISPTFDNDVLTNFAVQYNKAQAMRYSNGKLVA